MSLINQMLQDLEQRSVGDPIPSGIHGQIRAVPERRRIHPAWWLVLLLTLFLIGAVIWYLTRPAPARPVTPNLALKIDTQLGAMPSPAAQEPLPLDGAPSPLPAAPASPAVELPKPHADIARDLEHEAPREIEKQGEPKPQEQVKEQVKEQAKERALQEAASTKAEDTKPIGLTKQINELTPQQRAENEYREAGSLLQSGRQAEATAMLEQAVKLDPRHAGARQMLIGLMLQAKRNDDAMKLAQDGLALDPAQSGLTTILARVQFEQGDLHAALTTMEHGLSYAGTNAEYHAFMAALLIRDKRNKEAIEQYTVALTAQPQNGVWWMGIGMALQADNHLLEAREAYVRAERTDSLTPELRAFVDQRLAQLPKS